MQASDLSLGPYLRSVREQQGIDLQDIASLTKIQPKFIEAIEADDYKQLPKGPFVVGFLRSYAQCLSLDADEVVAFFQAHHHKRTPGLPVSPRQRSAQQCPAPTSRASWLRGAILSIGLAVLVVALLWLLRSGPSEPQATPQRPASTATGEPSATRQAASVPSAFPPPPPPQETTTSHMATTPSHSVSSTAIATAPTTTAPQQAEAVPPDTPTRALSEEPVLALPPLVLRVQALEETWMRVDIDDETRREALIQTGENIEWKANKQFSLTLGNLKGVRVLLNDRELDLPATRSNVLRDYVLTHALLNPRRTD
jgi:cytoskeleton protein RodZ